MDGQTVVCSIQWNIVLIPRYLTHPASARIGGICHHVDTSKLTLLCTDLQAHCKYFDRDTCFICMFLSKWIMWCAVSIMFLNVKMSMFIFWLWNIISISPGPLSKAWTRTIYGRTGTKKLKYSFGPMPIPDRLWQT